MKQRLTEIFAGMLLCAVSLAQDTTPLPPHGTSPQDQESPVATQASQPSSGQTRTAPRIAPGSVIPVQLTRTIDAKKVKTGDQVEAKVTQDMKAGNGQVLMAKDTKVIGHVTEAQARSKEQRESQVGIAFDHVVTKNGGDTPLPMSIQAIISPSTLNADNNANAGGEKAGTAPGAGGMSPSNASGRPGMSAGTPTQSPTASTAGSEGSTASEPGTNAHQPITGNTQGVVGISNLKLSTTANATEGSLLSSEKGNVKLDSGTLMLLRVSQ
jgi:hypothetical protein